MGNATTHLPDSQRYHLDFEEKRRNPNIYHIKSELKRTIFDYLVCSLLAFVNETPRAREMWNILIIQ